MGGSGTILGMVSRPLRHTYWHVPTWSPGHCGPGLSWAFIGSPALAVLRGPQGSTRPTLPRGLQSSSPQGLFPSILTAPCCPRP